MKSEILKLRKKIYKNLKERASRYEAPNQELIEYQKDQNLHAKREFNLSSMEHLIEKVVDSQVIFLGDFHTFDQNIRNVLRIIKILVAQKSDCIIGLEMISASHQIYIDAYLQRHLTDLEFLESINYNQSWRFPWSHYKLIFELAKEHNLKIIGLNKKGSLANRDRYAASLLTQSMLENQNSKILVLYGELHITKNKIPLLLKEFYPEASNVIIHQNLDDIYWRLIKHFDLEQGIIQFTSNEFCIVSAPPWIKYESMIYWYENLIDDPEFDIHEYIIETGAKIFVDDTYENFLNISLELSNHLNLKITKEDLEDFNLYDHTYLDYIEDKLETHLSAGLLSFYQYLLSTNKSFRFPNMPTFYCSSYSMNRISYLAGIHILHHFLTQNNISSFEILNSKSSTKKFLLFCYEAIFAYFFSKIINPHRKCDMYQDLSRKNTDYTVKAINILEGQKVSQAVTGVKMKDYYEVALYVGHILGEYLYQKANQKQAYRKIDLYMNDISETHFLTLRDLILKDEDYQVHSKRYF